MYVYDTGFLVRQIIGALHRFASSKRSERRLVSHWSVMQNEIFVARLL
jgi:hypothetical protein